MLRPINGINVDSFLNHFPEWARKMAEVSTAHVKVEQIAPHFPQSVNGLDDVLYHKVNFSLSCEPPNPKT